MLDWHLTSQTLKNDIETKSLTIKLSFIALKIHPVTSSIGTIISDSSYIAATQTVHIPFTINWSDQILYNTPLKSK